MIRSLAVLASLLSLASVTAARDVINVNREWRFTLGDPSGAEAPGFDDRAWQAIHLPHSFSLPYFMAPGFYTGYGWYRRQLDVPKDWSGKRVALEFEAAFQEAEIFVNGARVSTHRGGYVGFSLDITGELHPGANVVAVRLNNLWRPDLAPRAGDHTFSGGLYRDVRLVVTDPVHVAWCGTYVTTPTLASTYGASSTVRIRTELNNASDRARGLLIRTDIVDTHGVRVGSVSSRMEVPARASATAEQTTEPVERPLLWGPTSPTLYTAVTIVSDESGAELDRYETPFGFRWLEWTADRGFFLNGQHTYLRGANVHQDHAGWGDAVTNAAHERDVRLVKDAGFNFIRGSHYPKDPAFSDACDRLGVVWLSENIFWGMGGRHTDGAWNASAYPVTPEHEAAFEQSVLDSLRAMIRIHRNHPSIIAWSLSNEPFFSDAPIAKVAGLLKRSVALAHALDPTRPAAIGGAQRPLNADRIDRLGDLAAYNGDGADQPAFQEPGVPSLVSEYGSVVSDRPGRFDPGWGSSLQKQLTAGRPTQFPWRSGEAVWCLFDHGTHGGPGLATMGIVDYFRVPKRAYYWYREQYAGVPPPAWPLKESPTSIGLSADKRHLHSADGTDDAQLFIALQNDAGALVDAAVPVTLTIISGPGEFPTGRSITFTPPGHGAASDIAIRDGQAAIEFRSYHAGTTVLRASADGLRDATLRLETERGPTFVAGETPVAAERPYVRHDTAKAAPTTQDSATPVLALHRPAQASSSTQAAPAGLANDGDAATLWRADASSRGEVTWAVFLEAAYDVDRIAWTFPKPALHRYAVDVSVDGRSWRTVLDRATAIELGSGGEVRGDLGHGLQWLRVRFQVAEHSPVPALAEVSVGGIPTLSAP